MRHQDWQQYLAAFIKACSDTPFTWGDHDCALFACTCIAMMTGDDPGEAFRDKYDSEETAREALRKLYDGGLEHTAMRICAEKHYPEIPPLTAMPGDVAIIGQKTGATMGIVDLTGRYVMIAAERGIAKFPLTCIKRAWKVE